MIAPTAQVKDWDKIDPRSLLELVGVRRISYDFGFLLRHYWMPGSTLTYKRISEYRFGEMENSVTERLVLRPGRCTADIFCWRETTEREGFLGEPEGKAEQRATDGFARLLADRQDKEQLCLYDRSNQTFRTRPVTGETWTPESENEARLQAMLHVPILTPLLPIPLGFQWHVDGPDCYMEFKLESVTNIDSTPVLFVRRQGNVSYAAAGTIRREGVTAYALDRSTVLEDRIRDHVDKADIEIRHVTRLVRATYMPSPEKEEAY